MPDIRIESLRKVVHSLTDKISDERSLCDEWLNQLSEVIEDLVSREPLDDSEYGDCMYCKSQEKYTSISIHGSHWYTVHEDTCPWRNLHDCQINTETTQG